MFKKLAYLIAFAAPVAGAFAQEATDPVTIVNGFSASTYVTAGVTLATVVAAGLVGIKLGRKFLNKGT